jgi:uncharacterized protein (DUF433 family)
VRRSGERESGRVGEWGSGGAGEWEKEKSVHQIAVSPAPPLSRSPAPSRQQEFALLFSLDRWKLLAEFSRVGVATMVELDNTLTLPFRQIPDGTIRIGDTRVSLETIIDSYLLGQRPEEIHSGFSSIELADIYAIIAYYLKNREAVDRYLAEQEADSQRILDDLAKIPGNAEKRQAFIKRCLESRDLNAAA